MRIKSLLLIILSSLSLHAQAETLQQQDIFINNKIKHFMQENHIPGVALALYANAKPYEYYFGYANIESKDPVINKTIFEIGSISKVMTTVLFAQEIDWAKMSLTDPITKYIKDLPAPFEKITLQNLATHTSELPFDLPETITNQEELKNYLTTVKLTPPNHHYIYSNVGIALLNSALETSTDSQFADLYRRHILNPLKMVNGLTIPKVYEKYYAQGYEANGKPAARVAAFFPGSYGIKASTIDMQHFLSAAIGLPGTPPRVFYPMRMTQSVYAKVPNGYQGLGWTIHKLNENNQRYLINADDYHGSAPAPILHTFDRPLYSGDVLIDKTGMTDGFNAYIAVIPAKLSGIVIMVNKNTSEKKLIQLAREILFTIV